MKPETRQAIIRNLSAIILLLTIIGLIVMSGFFVKLAILLFKWGYHLI